MELPKPVLGAEVPVRSIEEYRGRTDPEAVKAAAQEMESVFAYELLKAMRAASKSLSPDRLGKDTYTSLFDMELSKLIAKRGFGLKEMMLQGIEKRNSTEESTVNETAGDAGSGMIDLEHR